MTTLIVNAKIVNEGQWLERDLIRDDTFEKIIAISNRPPQKNRRAKDASFFGSYRRPGDFREPDFMHKADIFTESRAAVAGGRYDFHGNAQPIPPTFTQNLLKQKYATAAVNSLANYSFYIGASNDNLEEG